MDSLGNLPHDDGIEKLSTANYCPRCGTKVEQGVGHRPDCEGGKNGGSVRDS